MDIMTTGDLQVGDYVQYRPRLMSDTDMPTIGKIMALEPKGMLFNVDMVVIDTVDHWIPAHETQILPEEVK
jgi:hypothetical protein